MRKYWLIAIALMITLTLGSTALANSHSGQGAGKADKAKEMKTKMSGVNALQKESVQLRKELNSAVQELRQALVKAQKDGKKAEEIAKLVPGIKALKAPLDDALKAQAEDEAEEKKFNEAKKGKNADAATKAIEVRTAKLQAKNAALKQALAAVKDLQAQIAAIK